MPRIISGFPGIGKTRYAQCHPGIVRDLDSKQHRWSRGFPESYIAQILAHAAITKDGEILVSTHEEVLDALTANGLEFTLVFPALTLKEEYLERYRQRGDAPQLLDALSKNWSRYIYQCQSRTDCRKIVLNSKQVLSDVVTP